MTSSVGCRSVRNPVCSGLVPGEERVTGRNGNLIVAPGPMTARLIPASPPRGALSVFSYQKGASI